MNRNIDLDDYYYYIACWNLEFEQFYSYYIFLIPNIQPIFMCKLNHLF